MEKKTIDRFQNTIDRMKSAKTMDEILIGSRDRILSLTDADKIIIYAYDQPRNELYTRYLIGSDIKEQRLPADSRSIPGYVVKTGKSVCIKDVYNPKELASIDPRLCFDDAWDTKNNYQTGSVLTCPVKYKTRVLGAVFLSNPKGRPFFTEKEKSALEKITKKMGGIFNEKTGHSLPPRFTYLIENKIITPQILKKALSEASKTGRDIETFLIENFQIPKSEIGKSLVHYYGCPFFDYRATIDFQPEAAKGINLDYLKRMAWVPIESKEGITVIAVDNPYSVKTTEIANLIPTPKVEYRVALKADILKLIDDIATAWTTKKESISDIMRELKVVEKGPLEEEEVGLETDASIIVRLAQQLIIDGYNAGASDIHIEPEISRNLTHIRFRVDGVCTKYQVMPMNYTRELISRIKIMANLDIAEKRLPQDGKLKFKYRNKNLELRIATVPTVKGENMVMRILASSEPMPLYAMGLSRKNFEQLRRIIEQPYGIILVVGPTGSGKTTTLHSALGAINTSEKKIWTAEDPVEITQPGLCQVEVKPKINYTFASALRSFLRADPDIIMIGEMRDLETASIAVEASLTGHLVFSTLHTNSAPETITRLLDMGIDPFNFADALQGILAQRLVRRLCQKCKQAYHPGKEEFNMLVTAYGGQNVFSELRVRHTPKLILYRPRGCDACSNSGYKGRIALHELLVGTPAIKKIILAGGTIDEIRHQAVLDGMRVLRADGVKKVLSGDTDYSQIRLACAIQ